MNMDLHQVSSQEVGENGLVSQTSPLMAHHDDPSLTSFVPSVNIFIETLIYIRHSLKCLFCLKYPFGMFHIFLKTSFITSPTQHSPEVVVINRKTTLGPEKRTKKKRITPKQRLRTMYQILNKNVDIGKHYLT